MRARALPFNAEKKKNLNLGSFQSSETVGEEVRRGQEAGRAQQLMMFHLLSFTSPGSQEFWWAYYVPGTWSCGV